MGGILTGLIRGATQARLGYSQGQQEHAERQSEVDKQRQLQEQMALRLALEEANRKRLQANSDRDYGLKAMEAMNKPKPSAPRVDPLSPEGITASAKKEETLAKIRSKYRAPKGTGKESGGEVASTGDVRRESMANKFVDMYLEGYGGDVKKALTVINSTPAEANKAKALGLTFTHWRAGVARRQAKQSKVDYNE